MISFWYKDGPERLPKRENTREGAGCQESHHVAGRWTWSRRRKTCRGQGKGHLSRGPTVDRVCAGNKAECAPEDKSNVSQIIIDQGDWSWGLSPHHTLGETTENHFTLYMREHRDRKQSERAGGKENSLFYCYLLANMVCMIEMEIQR